MAPWLQMQHLVHFNELPPRGSRVAQASLALERVHALLGEARVERMLPRVLDWEAGFASDQIRALGLQQDVHCSAWNLLGNPCTTSTMSLQQTTHESRSISGCNKRELTAPWSVLGRALGAAHDLSVVLPQPPGRRDREAHVRAAQSLRRIPRRQQIAREEASAGSGCGHLAADHSSLIGSLGRPI